MKAKSTFYPRSRIDNAISNSANFPWANEIQSKAIEDAKPYLACSDDELWNSIFYSSLPRSWMVLSYGDCPSCGESVPMYNWKIDPAKHPWKAQCPHCGELFPKNDFYAYYRSGLNKAGEFCYDLADSSLLYNEEHPDRDDPLHLFGVDDGHGYKHQDKPHLFIAAYLVYGQWKKVILDAINKLSEAYSLTGEKIYAHKTAVLLDRLADFFPTFSWAEQGVMYDGIHINQGYISYNIDSCGECLSLGLAYDRVFEAIREDEELVKFLAAKAAETGIENRKLTFSDIQKNIEERILQDVIENVYIKNPCNYPYTPLSDLMLRAVLDWPNNKEDVLARIDAIMQKSTAVDSVSGEKGTAGYACSAPGGVAEMLSWFQQADENFLAEMYRRYPNLADTYTFHIDTWCMQRFYPGVGDMAGEEVNFSGSTTKYPALNWCGVEDFRRSWLWRLYKLTGDVRFVQVQYINLPKPVENFSPSSIFDTDTDAAAAEFMQVIETHGTHIQQRSVNKQQWHLGLLRSGTPETERTAWISYDSGGGHGHKNGMNLGLFGKGMNLMPDLGYPPVHLGGGWSAPYMDWYAGAASHNTVVIDGKELNHDHNLFVQTHGDTTLWAEGEKLRAMRFSGALMINGPQYERGIYMVELGNDDFYLLDVFRVIGGREHIKFQHTTVGEAVTEGLTLTPAEINDFNGFMKNYRGGKAAPGWSVDWHVRDASYREAKETNVHVRYTDLTENAEGYLADGWYSPHFDNTETAYLTRAAARRTAEEEGLVSAFVSVIEPYEGKRTLREIKRLALDGASVQDCAVEVTRADGAKDLLISLDQEDPLGLRKGDGAVVQKDWNVRFRGDFCMVQKDESGRVCRITLANARELVVGDIAVTVPVEFAEITVGNGE